MKMESELRELKSMLRSLVVSSPTDVDLRTLLRDYRNMMGEPIPLVKFGYRDGLAFIKEQCSDCFVVQDSGNNPVLTLIVPDSVKHIDKFVQKQKATPTTRYKGKRRSIPESAIRNGNLIVSTFKAKANIKKAEHAVAEENKELLVIHNNSNSSDRTARDATSEELVTGVDSTEQENAPVTNGVCETDALRKFMQKRIPVFNSSQCLDSAICLDEDSSKGDPDSGRQTWSSNTSRKRLQLDELKKEVRELIAAVPEGVWCTELMRLYREKYGRELNFSRFGFTSVLSLAYAVEDLQYCVAEHSDQLLLRVVSGATSNGRAEGYCARYVRCAHSTSLPTRRDHPTGDPEDALPGINFDEDVFPPDCMHIMQSIPTQSLDELAPGAMLEVVVGEVYSPTHFWLLRLGLTYYSAMETLMDDMNEYYRGEGRERALAGGALRVGHYCACCYLGDWHRAVVVKIVDSDNVKVRHVDYATVETVAARSLKPLLLRWAALPAQALRARLAGVRPPAAGRRWPWAAAAHFLSLVKERRLVANVVAKDTQEGILEVLLIDTFTDEDVCIGTEMCRSGHADPRPDSALGTSECYLYPRFEALETGDTPNYAEIYCYLRDGISLEFVEDYRRHVPPCLPPSASLGWRCISPASVSCERTPSPCEPSTPVRLTSHLARTLSPLLPESLPTSHESEPPPRDSTLSLREPNLMPLPIVTATSSLGQLEEATRPVDSKHVTSLRRSTEANSWLTSVEVNRVPLLCSETAASPESTRPRPQCTRQPQRSESLPAHGCAAPVYAHPHTYPHSQLYPSIKRVAPLLYPQSYSALQLSPPPSHNFPGPFPVYLSEYSRASIPQAPSGEVSVPVSECEIFSLLNRVDPVAAHRYMVDALNRAVANVYVTRGGPAPVSSPRVSAQPQPQPPPGP